MITHQPNNIVELDAFCQNAGISLIDELFTRIHDSCAEGSAGPIIAAKLVMFMVFPKKRHRDEDAESHEVWAFGCTADIKQLAVALGVMGSTAGFTGLLVGQNRPAPDVEKLKEIQVLPMRPVFTLGRSACSEFNGLSPCKQAITLIGAGALDSQIFNNLVRQGFGCWTIIDKDTLYPHNLARHALDGDSVGLPKASSLAGLANSIIDDSPPVECIIADVLNPGSARGHIEHTLNAAEIVLDASASIAVARYLALEALGNGRRVSMFLNPAGTRLRPPESSRREPKAPEFLPGHRSDTSSRVRGRRNHSRREYGHHRHV